MFAIPSSPARTKRPPWPGVGLFAVFSMVGLCWQGETRLIAESDEIHVFRSLPADRVTLYKGKPNHGGGHPLVCQLKSKKILAVFQLWEGPGSDARVMSTRSKDRGLHWSPPQVVVGSDRMHANPSLGVLEDGTVLLGYQTWRSHFKGSTAEIRFVSYEVIRSSDDGHTWSEPAKIPADPPRGIASYSRIVQLPDGTALLPLYLYVEGGREDPDIPLSEKQDHSYVYRSRDGGKSWGDRSLIAKGFNETNLIHLQSGKLLAFLREQEKPPGRSALSESSDGGHRWTQPRFITGAGEHPGTLEQMEDGMVVLSYGVRHPPYGAQAILSNDDGRTWDQRNKIMIGFHSFGGGGYPCTIRLDSGHLLTLYYGYERPREGHVSFVQAVRWKVPAR